MRRRFAVPVLLAIGLVGASACSGGAPASSSERADSVTQRQRDSVIGESGLPGAKGVMRALGASDAAARRAAAIDSIQQEQ